jgi:chromosome segregation protein
VTRDGDVLGAHFAAGGSTSKQSLIEVQAAISQADEDLARAVHTLERLRFEQEAAEVARAGAQERVDAALGRLHESDATMAAVAENLGHLGATSRAARGEADRLTVAIAAAKESRAGDLSGLAELEDRLSQAESAPEEEPDTALLEELADAASTLRKAETEARLALRTNEERVRALAGQVTALFEAAEAEREARIKAKERRERQLREAETAKAVIHASDQVLVRLEQSVSRAAALRAEIEASRTGREETLRTVRVQLREQIAELDGLTDSVHKDEMARAEMRLRLEGLEGRALEELGLEVDTLVADYGPDQLVPPIMEDGDGEPGDPVPYDREAQVKRLRAAERSMAMLGKVNPLALEEFTALEERHQFLSEQLDDLRKTRQDLLEIVEEVDAKVEQVFTEAWYDVEREFQDVFSRLFPGGEGALILTDPQNMLTTGIDVEARPPGKKVKRLSLLSGGERSLVAVAFLVALFKARPSPFYILDEVEAALDDANLGRLLDLYEELRANSQLIVITHQKRTMEVADALYGVSMRGDGVSAVISQRLRDEESA